MLLELDDIVDTLVNAKRWGKKCCVLIGAGCSVSAGIPTANGFLDIIKTRFPHSYERAEHKKYMECMAQLSEEERRSLISEYVDSSKINWGHIALAQLMKEGYVDRILTTNFDSLMVQACALVGIHPAVYDIASSQKFVPSQVPDLAIFHLHGQRSGFILINTEEQYKKQTKLIKPVLQDVLHSHVWIVVGYSGENDPTFKILAKNKTFENRLFWIGFNDNEPGDNLKGRLLTNKKDAHFIKGYDSDSFFGKLAGKLSCFPPDFVGRPFTYLDNLFETITPYSISTTNEPIDYVRYAREFIQEAIRDKENVQKDVLQAMADLMGEKYEQVIALKTKYAADEIHRDLAFAISWALVMQGNQTSDQAKAKTGPEADALFTQAYEKYAAALQIKADFHEAFNNWGNALSDQAKTKTGPKADALFTQAYEKYAAALQIKADKHEALNNWGNALSAQAKTKTGPEADALFTQAYEKYAAALQIKADKHEAFYNWGSALSDQAKTKTSPEADALFTQAYEKYAAALQVKADFHEALNNWGNALSDQANTKTGPEADALFTQAYEKYAAAFQVKADFHEAFYNWGSALSAQARTKAGPEADALFTQAYEKYAAALQVKADFHEALNNWGNALSDQAKAKTGPEADALFTQAYEKYAAALQIKADFHEAFYNWGSALSDQAKTKTSPEADALFTQAYEKYAAALQVKADFHEALNNWGIALLYQCRIVPAERKSEILSQALSLFEKAEKLVPGYSAYNLACTYSLMEIFQECQNWLEKSYQLNTLSSLEDIANDSDLNPVRDQDWFKEFLEKVKKERGW